MSVNTNIDPTQGGGPWSFDAPELASGETWGINFRKKKYNGKARWFTPYLPLDEAKVYNRDADNLVEVTFNGRYDLPVLPNTIEPFTDAGVVYFKVENKGSTTIASGDVKVSVAKNPWNSDKEARARKQAHPVQRALSDIVPGGIL